jgi:hypothetical protein
VSPPFLFDHCPTGLTLPFFYRLTFAIVSRYPFFIDHACLKGTVVVKKGGCGHTSTGDRTAHTPVQPWLGAWSKRNFPWSKCSVGRRLFERRRSALKGAGGSRSNKQGRADMIYGVHSMKPKRTASAVGIQKGESGATLLLIDHFPSFCRDYGSRAFEGAACAV